MAERTALSIRVIRPAKPYATPELCYFAWQRTADGETAIEEEMADPYIQPVG